MRVWLGRVASRVGSAARMPSRTSRLSALAPASAKPTGRPCSVQTRCRRSPQKERLWLARKPYPAHTGGPCVGRGASKREADRQAVQRADKVQAQPPEVAAVAGAVAVFGPSGQLGAVGGLGRPAALYGGGVAYPHVIGPPGRVAGQHADGPLEQAGGCPQALVVAGLAGQVGKQVA